MRGTVVALAAALALAVPIDRAHAQQTCQAIGQQVYCYGGNLTNQQNIGSSTYYNYNNPQQAKRQGLPSSSQQIGNTRYYDNGTTRQSIGNTDYYSNGTTRQRIGNFDYYSNGTTCQTIGTMRYCN
jgi:hypothetical protein